MAQPSPFGKEDRVATKSGRYGSRYPGFYGSQQSPLTDNVIQGTPQTSPKPIITGEADQATIGGSGQDATTGGSDSSALSDIYADQKPAAPPEMPSIGEIAKGVGKGVGKSLLMSAGQGAGAAIGSALYSGGMSGGFGSLASAGLEGAQNALSYSTFGLIPEAEAGLSGLSGISAGVPATGLEGSWNYATSGSSLASAAGAGVGTAIVDFAITGDIGHAAKAGVGGAAGYYIGGTLGSVFGPVGTAIGSFLGSTIGSWAAGLF